MNAMKSFTAGAVALALSFSVAKAADIVETAVAAGSFNTLVTAVKAAGLVDTLKGPGPFTVFSPTDEAFAKLPGGTVENSAQARKQAATRCDPDLSRRARKGDVEGYLRQENDGENA